MEKSKFDLLKELPVAKQRAFWDDLEEHEAAALLSSWRDFYARDSQVAPNGDWSFWLIMSGRGFGKTRAGSEWIREKVKSGIKRIALVAETQRDLEKVMIEGDSGLLSVIPQNEQPRYTKKPVELVFTNGCVIQGFNATQPDQLRGPQFGAAWCDELAKFRYARETWDQLQFGMRLGDNPQTLITTTPRPIELIKSLVSGAEGEIVISRGTTHDNASNLSKKFLSTIEAKHKNTRLGRQELEGEILGDTPNSLWRQSQLDLYRKNSMPEIQRIVVAVDPAVTNTDSSDEHGIIVCGLSGKDGVVIEDGSTKGSPLDWARRAISLYDEYSADAIVIEVNQGGDMVSHTLRSVRQGLKIIEVRASRGKHIRAEPIAAMYEQGRISHLGRFDDLEGQMTQMTSNGYNGSGSPDRLDALVWGLTELFPAFINQKTIVTGKMIPVFQPMA